MPEKKLKVKNPVFAKASAGKQKSKIAKTAIKKPAGLSVSVYSLAGTASGSLKLPKELFGAEINQALIAQAVRVYLNNATAHHSHTKTRSEVQGSTRKIYKQKGTGGARHGGIRAPIFVGGGIALGPKYRKINLSLSKKMKKAALKSVLSAKFKDGQVLGVTNLDKAEGKTSQLVKFLEKISQRNALILTDGKNEKLARAVRGIPALKIQLASQANILEIIKFKTLILTKEAVKDLELRVKSKEGEK